MITVEFTKTQYRGTDKWAPGRDLKVAVWRGDDLPSNKVAEVDGDGLGDRLRRAVVIARALSCDLRVQARFWERWSVTVWQNKVSPGSSLSLGPCYLVNTDGAIDVHRYERKRVEPEPDLLAEVAATLVALGVKPENQWFQDGTIGTPDDPRPCRDAQLELCRSVAKLRLGPGLGGRQDWIDRAMGLAEEAWRLTKEQEKSDGES